MREEEYKLSWVAIFIFIMIISVTLIIAGCQNQTKKLNKMEEKRLAHNMEEKRLAYNEELDVEYKKGWDAATRTIQYEAIKAGVGEWTVIDKFGSTEFKWLSPTNVFKE